MKRRRWPLAIAITLAVLVGAAAAPELRRHTPAFTDSAGHPLPQSIAEIVQVTLNGSRQEVWLRGADRRKPLLVLLHGGPGASESALFRHFASGLESHFLVVYWDQRGTGRSLSAAWSKPPSTAVLLEDMDALVTYLTTRFGHQRVVLLGQR